MQAVLVWTRCGASEAPRLVGTSGWLEAASNLPPRGQSHEPLFLAECESLSARHFSFKPCLNEKWSRRSCLAAKPDTSHQPPATAQAFVFSWCSCASIAPLGTQTTRDLIGRTLGHYRIVDKIGEGGMFYG